MGYVDLKELLRDAKNFAEGANDINLKSKLLDIQGEIFEMQEENRKLREENHNLKNDKILTSELKYHEGVFYHEKNHRYICATCWENNGKYISVSDHTNPGDRIKVFWCETCKRPRYTNIENN